MMRVALVAGPDPGHAFPVTALARALREDRHETLVVTGDRWRAAIEREGLGYASLPRLAAHPGDRDMGFRLYGRAADMAPPLAEMLAEWRPDLVVADTLTVAGGWAADIVRLPWVELVPTLLQDASRVLPPPGSAMVPGRTPLGRSRDALLRRMHARSLAKAATQRATARGAIGLPPRSVPVARLIATLPALEVARPDWPAEAHVVGPLEWDPVAAELPAPRGDGPLVFVSDSTADGRAQSLFDTVVAGLRESAVRVACTRFSAYDGGLPPSMVAGPGRQAPLLDEAALVVAAAGHGTVAKALARGLPLVMVPGPGDQAEIAARVVRLGAGIAILRRRLSPARLAGAVFTILGDPSYRAAAGRVAASAQGLGPAYAARLVGDFAASR